MCVCLDMKRVELSVVLRDLHKVFMVKYHEEHYTMTMRPGKIDYRRMDGG